MMNAMKYTFYIVMCVQFFVNAQDAHLSQYDASKVMLNPAFTGMNLNGSERTAINFRSQWASLGSKITTTAMAYDVNVKELWGVGGYLSYSDGSGVLNTVNMILSAARDVSRPDQEKHKMSVGMQLGLIYKSTSSLLFDNQYSAEGGYFNANLPSGENQDKFSRLMPDLNFGYTYQMEDKESNVNPYAGMAIFHALSPKENLLSSSIDSRLPRRWVFYGGAKIRENASEKKGVNLIPNFLYMRQGNSSELNIGLMLEQEISESVSVSGGLSLRWKDALIPSLAVQYKKFIYRLNYDVNVSKLREFSGGKGAIELSVVMLNKH